MDTPSLIPSRKRSKAARSAQPDPDALTPLLTETQAAKILRLSPRTLQARRYRGQGPPYVKLGTMVRYRRSDLREYILRTVRSRTSHGD